MSKRSARSNPSHPFNAGAQARRAAHAAQLFNDIAGMAVCGDVQALQQGQSFGIDLSRNRTFIHRGQPGRTATPLIFMIDHHHNSAIDWLLRQRINLDYVSWVNSGSYGTVRGTALDAACEQNGTRYIDQLLKAGARKVILPTSRARLNGNRTEPVVQLPF